MSTCPFCHTPINAGEEFVICPEDKSIHHRICWDSNNLRCANFQCGGAGELPIHVLSKHPPLQNPVFSQIRGIVAQIVNENKYLDTSTRPISALLALTGAAISFLVWFLLLSSTIPGILNYIGLENFALPISVAVSILGLFLGVRFPVREIERSIYLVAGWGFLKLCAEWLVWLGELEASVGTLFANLPYQSFLTDLAGVIGIIVGCFFGEIRPKLIRGLIGGVFGLLVIEYFSLFLAFELGVTEWLLPIRFIIFSLALFLPLLWAPALLPFVGAFNSLLVCLLFFLFSGKTPAEPLEIAVFGLIAVLAGTYAVSNKYKESSSMSIKDVLTASLLGCVSFTHVLWIMLIVNILGYLLKPVLSFVFFEISLSSYVEDIIWNVFTLTAGEMYQYCISYWSPIVMLYGSLFGLKYLIRSELFSFLHGSIRLLVLLGLGLGAGFILEQNFERIIFSWQLYNPIRDAIYFIKDLMLLLSLAIAFIFILFHIGARVPFWVILLNFVVWFLQILFFMGLLVLPGYWVGALVGWITTNLIVENIIVFNDLPPDIAFGWLGAYLGLLIGSGYFLYHGVQGNLGWLSSKLHSLAARIFPWLEDEIIRFLSFNRPVWQHIIFSLVGIAVYLLR